MAQPEVRMKGDDGSEGLDCVGGSASAAATSSNLSVMKPGREKAFFQVPCGGESC